MLSASPSDASSGRHDFYNWNGSFLRSIPAVGRGGALTSIDGHYFVAFTAPNQGALWTSTGSVVRTFVEPSDSQKSTPFNWAEDGDYFCALEAQASGYAVVAEDVAGKMQRFPLRLPSDVVPPERLRSMNVGCSLTADRAVVFGIISRAGLYSYTQVAVMSLSDGRLISEYRQDAASGSASPDLHWLAATTIDTTGWHTEIIDSATGVIQTRLDGFLTFAPDGERLVGTDDQGFAAVIDWRSKTELWRGPSHLVTVVAHSDPATNMMLLWLSTGSAQAGTETYDYWIVDGRSAGKRLAPRGCAPIEASPTRLCWPA